MIYEKLEKWVTLNGRGTSDLFLPHGRITCKDIQMRCIWTHSESGCVWAFPLAIQKLCCSNRSYSCNSVSVCQLWRHKYRGDWFRLKTSAGCLDAGWGLGVLGKESGRRRRRTLKQLISGQLPIENADKRDFWRKHEMIRFGSAEFRKAIQKLDCKFQISWNFATNEKRNLHYPWVCKNLFFDLKMNQSRTF